MQGDGQYTLVGQFNHGRQAAVHFGVHVHRYCVCAMVSSLQLRTNHIYLHVLYRPISTISQHIDMFKRRDMCVSSQM